MLGAPMRIHWSALSAPFLFAAALVAALFFQGFYTEFFGLSLTFLVLWLAYVVWQGYSCGFQIPKTRVALWLTLLWVWLGLSISSGKVFYISVIDFWWVGSLPLVFWIYTLSPEKDRTWRLAFILAVAVGAALSLTAVYQSLVLGLEPTATFLNKNSLAALLNLIALPLSAYFLLNHGTNQKWTMWFIGVGVFVLFLGVALIKGRGAILSGAVSLGILAWLCAGHVPKRMILLLMAIIVSAFLAASGLGQLDLAGRMSTVLDPWNAGATRTVIWAQAWEMLKESPWLGVGPGHFALIWPPYRHPGDSSAGYFVHNDYLQIWIETGLPGLVMLLATFIAVAHLFVRAARHPHTKPRDKVEMAGLFCGLLAIAAHSFVDFNFHILSILILAGLVLGRLHALAWQTTQPNYFGISPTVFVSVSVYRAMTVLLMAFPLVHFITLGWASYEYRKGLELAGEGKLEAAYDVFTTAVRLFPDADNVLMSQADLLRHLLTALPEASHMERKALFDEAWKLLDRAERLNPYRPQTFAVRARLYEQNPLLTGKDWTEQAINAYRQALRVNPRIYEVRYMCAKLMLSLGRPEDAHRILEEGTQYWYFEYDHIVPFYALTAKLRRETGDSAGAELLRNKIVQALKNSGRRWMLDRDKASPIETRD